MKRTVLILCLLAGSALSVFAQLKSSPITRADSLRGNYGPLKSCYDISYYHLDIKLDIDNKAISGSNEIQFTATHLEPMLNGELDYMALHNIQPMAWNPLGSFYKEAIPQTIRLRDLLQKLTEKYGLSDDLLLLAWVLKHPAAIQPVVGTTQIDRIKNLKKLQGFELELEDWFAIWTESIGTKIP